MPTWNRSRGDKEGLPYKDKVLRAAMVKVAKAPSKQEEKDDDREQA